MAIDQQFGGNWTEDKLERVRKYLCAYATIMKKYPYFKFAYIDAFAGTGYRELEKENTDQKYLYPELVDEDMEEYADGSTRIALQVEPEFSKYIFIEKSKNRFDKLESLEKDFPDKANKIILIHADAKNNPIYLLCFASGNPKGAKTAIKIAQDILGK